MTHSMTQEDSAQADQRNDSIEIAHTGHSFRDEPLPRAKPHERITRGIPVEDFFGICAEEFDDEYMDAVLAIRRGVRPRERRS